MVCPNRRAGLIVHFDYRDKHYGHNHHDRYHSVVCRASRGAVYLTVTACALDGRCAARGAVEMTMTMNAQALVDRYLYGHPLSVTERASLARQLRGAHNASKAIRMAREEAAKACHDWRPAEPHAGWVAICYVKHKCVWRVMRDGEIVAKHLAESDARSAGAMLAANVNAEWRGLIANPRP